MFIPDLDFSIPDPDPQHGFDNECKYFYREKLLLSSWEIRIEMFIPDPDFSIRYPRCQYFSVQINELRSIVRRTHCCRVRSTSPASSSTGTSTPSAPTPGSRSGTSSALTAPSPQKYRRQDRDPQSKKR